MAVDKKKKLMGCIEFLNYIEKKGGAGEARKYADKILGERKLSAYFGSITDGKLFEATPGIPEPNEKDLDELIKLSMECMRSYHGWIYNGPKKDFQKILVKYGLDAEFGSVL
jgi:hypothetical protein